MLLIMHHSFCGSHWKKQAHHSRLYWVLSDECETVSDWRMHQGLGRQQLPPLGEGCGAVFFEVFSGVEVTFEIEVVVD